MQFYSSQIAVNCIKGFGKVNKCWLFISALENGRNSTPRNTFMLGPLTAGRTLGFPSWSGKAPFLKDCGRDRGSQSRCRIDTLFPRAPHCPSVVAVVFFKWTWALDTGDGLTRLWTCAFTEFHDRLDPWFPVFLAADSTCSQLSSTLWVAWRLPAG